MFVCQSETTSPLAELSAAVSLLGGCVERFDTVADTFEPVGNGSEDGCFISASYDATRCVPHVWPDLFLR